MILTKEEQKRLDKVTELQIKIANGEASRYVDCDLETSLMRDEMISLLGDLVDKVKTMQKEELEQIKVVLTDLDNSTQ